MTISAPVRRGPLKLAAWRTVGIAGAICVCLTIPQSPATAGFFDFLFPPQPAAPARLAVPLPRRSAHFFHRPQVDVWSRQHPRRAYSESQRGRFGHPEKKLAAAVHHHKFVEAKAPPPAHVVIGLMDDDSLREGDAVMTQDGLRIFVGDEGRHHDPDDFAKLSEVDSLSKRQRSALLAVDPLRADGAPQPAPQPELLVGRSAADDAGLSAGQIIVDPRGNKIRYVGP